MKEKQLFNDEKEIISGKAGHIWGFFAVIFIILAIWFLMEYCAVLAGKATPTVPSLLKVTLCVGIAVLICIISSCQIIVTNKRVTGKTLFGKQVSIPFDSILGVSSTSLKGIVVLSPFGKTKFCCIKNRNEVYYKISEILTHRQINH